ncbi:MAG: SHOCT domain-containing protein [Clostridia bacterium]|nr:SHOCT domain-containing protein [Clostridia bacterium]
MPIRAMKCPNCGASFDPKTRRCEYCGSYIIVSDDKYADLGKFDFAPPADAEKYPGIYVFGRLLGKGEKPIALGLANCMKGPIASGGKLLLTSESLSFSAHAFNAGPGELNIGLGEIEDIALGANMLISQKIRVTAGGKKHSFVVYHGKDWVEKIRAAVDSFRARGNAGSAETAPADYTEELVKLKQLADAGVITAAEFAEKKRQLLGL